MSSAMETVTKLVTPILEEQNFELMEVEFVKEGRNRFLRVLIDKEGGIDIEECVFISEKLSEKLDVMDPDPIPQAYFLEVSSPGAECPSKKESDYEQAVGKYIHISPHQTVDGEEQVKGILVHPDPEQLTLSVKIKTRVKEMTFERKNIAKARLAIQFQLAELNVKKGPLKVLPLAGPVTSFNEKSLPWKKNHLFSFNESTGGKEKQ